MVSGEPFDQFIERRICGPLGMVDTGFWVAPEKGPRVVAIHTYDAAGNRLTLIQR